MASHVFHNQIVLAKNTGKIKEIREGRGGGLVPVMGRWLLE